MFSLLECEPVKWDKSNSHRDKKPMIDLAPSENELPLSLLRRKHFLFTNHFYTKCRVGYNEIW